MILRIALLIALLLPLRSTNAEPGPVGQWLMSTPASLWTVGMTKLQSYVFGWRESHPLAKFSRGVWYDWDQNRIIISASTDEAFDEVTCGFYLNEARKSGGVFEGRLGENLSYSIYSMKFERGFSDGSEPDDYLRKLDDIILLKISMNGGLCEGRLLSTQVLIER